MGEVIRGLPFVYTFIDDLLIASETAEEHKQHLNILFASLSEYGVIINPAKCVFGVSNLDFLGHHVDVHEMNRRMCSLCKNMRFRDIRV